MKIEIERSPEVFTPSTIRGFSAIITEAKEAKSLPELFDNLQSNVDISDQDYFVYRGSAHLAVHEYFPNGEKSERILFIS